MNRRRGLPFIIAGIVLIVAALGVVGYNLYSQYSADKAAEEITSQLDESIDPSDDPLYDIDPNMEMPVINIDGNDYIGTLYIAALDLELPVMSEWSYSGLRTAPCRYTGSAYSGGLVICAHNYDRHFGRIKTLGIGDAVTFTDVDGHVFNYSVTEIEQLSPTAVEEMISEDFDLTLFSCNLSGSARVTVRCMGNDT